MTKKKTKTASPVKVDPLVVNGKKIEIVYLPIDKLIPADYNPRKISDHDLEHLKKSLMHFGSIDPAIINTHKGREGIIVGGHQRIRAATALGWTEFPCVQVSLTLEKEKELNIRLNRNTGLFDFDVLKKEFAIENLFDFGFEKEDFIGTSLNQDVKDFLFNNPDIDKDEDDKNGENTDMSDVSDLVYCALRKRFDVGRGYCTHDCQYCFTRVTPAGNAQRKGRYKLSRPDDITDRIKEAKKDNQLATIGVCNDPSLNCFRDRLMHTLVMAEKHDVQCIIQTKNPKAILEAVKESGISSQRICLKVSFSFCTDDRAKIVEPNAPDVSHRIEAMKEAHAAGCDLILRFMPFFIGYPEGQEHVCKSLKGICDRMVCEPIRMSATGKEYFRQLEPLLTKHKNSLETYIKFFQAGAEEPLMYGAIHWYDYDKGLLHAEYKRLKALVNKYGMKFGICSGVLGFHHSELNEGDFCCQTKRMIENKISFDKYSLTALQASDRLKEIKIAMLSDKYFDNQQEYALMLHRIGWANEHLLSH